MHIHPKESTSPSSYPHFEPHITLGSHLDVQVLRESIRDLRQTGTVPVRFKSVDVGDAYFWSVYITIHPDSPIMELEQHIRKRLGKDVPPASYPHMSFTYIDNSEPQERRRIAEQLKAEGVIRLGDDKVTVHCPKIDATGDYEDVDGFEGAEIWIIACVGKVEDWKVLEKVTLTP